MLHNNEFGEMDKISSPFLFYNSLGSDICIIFTQRISPEIMTIYGYCNTDDTEENGIKMK